MEKNLPLIILTGPTASAKTATGIDVAFNLSEKLVDIEVVNFDSLLFYKELNIGTAKPSAHDLKKVKHHLIDICSINNPLNASLFCSMALDVIAGLHKKKIVPLLIGGSGFYLNALLNGMYDSSVMDQSISNKSN